jgi:hypothetical protein
MPKYTLILVSTNDRVNLEIDSLTSIDLKKEIARMRSESDGKNYESDHIRLLANGQELEGDLSIFKDKPIHVVISPIAHPESPKARAASLNTKSNKCNNFCTISYTSFTSLLNLHVQFFSITPTLPISTDFIRNVFSRRSDWWRTWISVPSN